MFTNVSLYHTFRYTLRLIRRTVKHEIFVTDVTTVYSTLKTTDLGSNGARIVDPKSLQMKKSTAA